MPHIQSKCNVFENIGQCMNTETAHVIWAYIASGQQAKAWMSLMPGSGPTDKVLAIFFFLGGGGGQDIYVIEE